MAQVKKLARETGRSMTEVIEDALRATVLDGAKPRRQAVMLVTANGEACCRASISTTRRPCWTAWTASGDAAGRNVLVYAHREDSPHHAAAVTGCSRRSRRSGVRRSRPRPSSVVRVVTHPRVFKQPSRLESRCAFVAGCCSSRTSSRWRRGRATGRSSRGCAASRRARQSRRRRLSGGAGHRVGQRVDHDRRRLCALLPASDGAVRSVR